MARGCWLGKAQVQIPPVISFRPHPGVFGDPQCGGQRHARQQREVGSQAWAHFLLPLWWEHLSVSLLKWEFVFQCYSPQL